LKIPFNREFSSDELTDGEETFKSKSIGNQIDVASFTPSNRGLRINNLNFNSQQLNI